jgi:uracil-DNA glycosylase family 4
MDKDQEMKKLNREYSRIPVRTRNWSLSNRFVPGEGPLDAKIMFIGQAPGQNEDVQLRPFVGTSGKFLTKLMEIAGLDRKSVYVASVVQFFPPKNRVPTDNEIEICKKFLLRQIKIVDPAVIVLLGAVACKTVLGLDKIASIRGTSVKRDGKTYLLSIHPAAAIRIRKNMPLMEKDFENFKRIIKSELD